MIRSVSAPAAAIACAGVFAFLLVALPAGAENNLVRSVFSSEPDTYIVTLKDTAPDPDVVSGRAEAHLNHSLERTHTYRFAIRGFAARLSTRDVAALQTHPDVESIIKDQPVSIFIERPGINSDADAFRSVRTEARRGGGTPPPQILPTGINRIDAENLANKGAGVEVAVIDTGIDYTHPDLSANVIGGKNCSSGSSYMDGNGHGTHVAGSIAAANNTIGVVGVAPAAKLWAVRVLNNYGSGSWSSIICGLDFVTSKAPANGGNIRVANMSLGGAGTPDSNCGNTNNDPLHKAVCRARDAGVVIIVAAGNNAGNTMQTVPAGYDDAVITVSALADSNGISGGGGAKTSYGTDDTFASFSNFGTAVDIGAPGVNIYSTYPGNKYSTMSGTSMASPHVAGAAALYLSANPGASWTAVRDALRAAGEVLGAGHTDPSGLHPEPVLKTNTF